MHSILMDQEDLHYRRNKHLSAVLGDEYRERIQDSRLCQGYILGNDEYSAEQIRDLLVEHKRLIEETPYLSVFGMKYANHQVLCPAPRQVYEDRDQVSMLAKEDLKAGNTTFESVKTCRPGVCIVPQGGDPAARTEMRNTEMRPLNHDSF
jgi:hypothetical protein